MIDAVAEAINAERTWVLAGAHAHPRRYGDWRGYAFQSPVHTSVHQPAKVYKALVAENYLRRGAIESEHANLHFRVVTFLPSSALQELLNVSGLWVQGQ